MRSIKIAGLALASMLVMSMAATGSASAALLWLVCLEGSGLTKYESSKCLKAASGGKWQSQGLKCCQRVTVKLVAISILLIDKETLVGEVAVKCSNAGSRGEGAIESGGTGEITVAEYENPKANCASEKGCEAGTVKKVKGVNLPWVTEIFTTEGKRLSKLKAGVAGKEPGWEVECEVLKIATTDVCTSPKGEEEQVRLVNTTSSTELLVTALFEEKFKAECTQSKKKSGEVKGSIAILLPGGALSINSV